MESFLQVESFLDQTANNSTVLPKKCLGGILVEFLQQISLSSEILFFEQILLLFICLLEFTRQQNESF